MTRVTPSGRGVLGAAVALYAGGVVLGYPELVVVAAAGLLALVLAAAFVLYRPRMSLERHVEPAEVVAGEAALGLLEVRNLSGHRSAGFVATDRVGTEQVEVAVPALVAGARTFVNYPLPTRRRGRLEHGPVTLLRTDPLALVRHAQPHGRAGALWVHPRTHPLRPLPAGVVLDLEGPMAEAPPRGSITFSSVREYVPGDDPRHIHWRSTARNMGTLMVREHVDTSQPRTTVALDTRAEAWTPEAFEEAVEVAASLAAGSDRRGHPVTLVLGTDGDHRPKASRMLDRLAEVEPAPEGDGWRLPWLLERQDHGGALVAVTGSLEPAVFGRLAVQRRRFAPVIVVSVTAGSPLRSGRRFGTVVIEAPTAREFAAAWNHLVHR